MIRAAVVLLALTACTDRPCVRHRLQPMWVGKSMMIVQVCAERAPPSAPVSTTTPDKATP